ncbi:MAG: hypothetical protein V1707_03825, partial [bacterium]
MFETPSFQAPTKEFIPITETALFYKQLEQAAKKIVPNAEVASYHAEIKQKENLEESDHKRKELLHCQDIAQALERATDPEKEGSTEAMKVVDNALEQEPGYRMYSKLKPNDRLLVMIFAGSGSTGIKALNDKLLGIDLTDELISYRKAVIKEKLSSMNINLEELEQTYKEGYFRLPQGSTLDQHKLETVCEEIARALAEKLSELAEHHVREVKQRPGEENQLLAKEIEDTITRVHQETTRKRFRFSYGLSGIITKDDPDRIETAISQALRAGRVAMAEERGGGFGQAYTTETMDKTIKLIEQTKRSLLTALKPEAVVPNVQLDQALADSVIIDNEGNRYPVMESCGGEWHFNRDVLRDVRKEKFSIHPSQKHILPLIRQYLERINIMDYIKPTSYGDLNEYRQRVEDITVVKKNIKQLLDGQTDKEEESTLKKKIQLEAKRLLETSHKNSEADSDFGFNRKALSYKNLFLLNFDKLDMGLDNIADFENVLEEIKTVKQEKAVLTAGDSVTDDLNQSRREIKKLLKNLHPKDMAMRVGGDEITAALNANYEQALKDEIVAVLLKLQKETGARLVVSGAYRNKEGRDEIGEQVEALKAAETGTKVAKEVEEAKRQGRRAVVTAVE